MKSNLMPTDAKIIACNGNNITLSISYGNIFSKKEQILANLEKYAATRKITTALFKKAYKFVNKKYDIIEYDVEDMNITKATEFAINVAKSL